MPILATLKLDCDSYFRLYSHKFDMAYSDECGRYMQVLIPHLQGIGYIEVGFLRKDPSRTNYKLHAIDSFAYDLGNNLTHAVDVIGNAEQPHPWRSEGGINDDPRASFSEDINTAYKTNKDWLKEPFKSSESVTNFPSYGSLGDDAFFRSTLGRTLAFDYSRAKEYPFNEGVVVWVSRTLHTTFENIIVHKMNPTDAINKAMENKRSEWCIILRVPVIPVPPNWVVP